MKNLIISSLLIFTILVSGCTSLKSVSTQVPEPAYWPTVGWQTSAPEAQGMDSNLLAQMLEKVNTNKTHIYSVLVIRNGYMVTEAYFNPYTRDTKMHVQSVTKSVVGALVGIAVKDGYIKSANEKLLSFFPHRTYANPGKNKDSIRLKHLLSMSSGFPCQEFSDSGQSMEQTSGWVQFMLDLPVDTPPGKTFGYCNGNPHLLSAILESKTSMHAREFANQELFKPLGIPMAMASDWWSDPQGFSNGGDGLFLKPIDMAKLGFLYLHNGKWDGQQLLPANWVADSTTPYIQKPEGPGYGYLWTVYPELGRYSALGLGGQQIHVYPSKNLIVVLTAELETYMEAPEIEHMLTDSILPSIKSDSPLTDNPAGIARLQEAIDLAANPIQPVPALPAIAEKISGQFFTLEENPNGWQKMMLIFKPGAKTAQINTTGSDDVEEIGLDNIYRPASLPADQYMMRGHWVDNQTFVIEWTPIGDIRSAEIRLKYSDNSIEIAIQSFIFGGKPLIIKGTK